MGLPKPCTHIVDENGLKWEVFRCKADGGIVLNTQSSLSYHAGHQVGSPVVLTSEELKQIEEELSC